MPNAQITPALAELMLSCPFRFQVVAFESCSWAEKMSDVMLLESTETVGP